MNFREFLEAKFNKSAFRGGSAVAVPQQSQAGRFDNATAGYADRVAYGKQMEDKVSMALQASGWKIRPPTQHNDMRDKIDGFKLDGSSAVPFQIKYRDSGDDILMEVHRGMLPAGTHPNFNGRDIVGSAEIYVCLNRAGNILRIRSAQEAKATAIKLAIQLLDENKRLGTTTITAPQGQVRMTTDPSSGVAKVMAFLNPSAFQKKQDIQLHQSLWAS